MTLVELLVAVALAATLLALLGAAIATGGRVAGDMARATAAAQRRALAWSLLRGELELAGRGLEDGLAGLGLVLDPAGAGSDRLRIRYRAEAHRAEPVDIDAWFFAAEDGRGRPNLYRRPEGGIRQPWLLGVTDVHVLEGRHADGRTLGRDRLVAGAEPAALHVEIRFDAGEPVRGWAWLARAGPLAEAEP